MLVLSRKVNEVIQIGEGISVMVVSIGPASVRLGIAAPDDATIMRRELVEAWSPVEDESGRPVADERQGRLGGSP